MKPLSLRAIRRARGRACGPVRVGLVALALVAVIGRSARADPPAADHGRAEALFRAARELAEAGKFHEACPKFAESYELDPQVGALLYLAACHEQEGKTATAWTEFNEAAEMAARAKQSDRETIARGRAARLEGRLSRLRIEGPIHGEAEILLDGKPLSPANREVAIPVDPGRHALEARAAGQRSWSQEVQIGPEARTTTIRIPELQPQQERGSAIVTVPPTPRPARQPPPSTRGAAWPRAVGWVALGVGVAGVAVAGVTSGLLASYHATVENECQNDLCSQAGLDAADKSRTLFPINTAAFIVGGVGLAAGAVLLLTTRTTAAKTTSLGGAMTPHGGALSLRSSF